MKVILVHNEYQVKGGEDSVFNNEKWLLDNNINVECYLVSNRSINGFLSRVFASVNTVFSIKAFLKFYLYLRKSKPDIVHVHNYFPILSPSIFYACKFFGVPVVHTLHNFRAICPTSLLMHKGKVTERSVKNSSFWALPKKVYRDSFLGTLILVLMIEVHKYIGTWKYTVDGYIALTEFSKKKYLEAGWPSNKIYVKPNFSVDPGINDKSRKPYVLFVGRLSDEKGILFLLEAFKKTTLLLKIAGDGPLLNVVQENKTGNVEYLGCLSKDEVATHMKEASCLVMASNWYEGFPMVIVEALSHGLPIVVPKLGNMKSVVEHELSGLHYEPNNDLDLLTALEKIVFDVELNKKFSDYARYRYLQSYTEEINRKQLLDIYSEVILSKKREV